MTVRVGDSVRAQYDDRWIVGHSWIETDAWNRMPGPGQIRILEASVRSLLIQAPDRNPGPWLSWRAEPHPTGMTAVILEHIGRGW